MVIGVEDGHAVSRQRGRQLALGCRDALQAAELPRMRVPHAEHRPEPGRRDRAQLRDVPEPARGQLRHEVAGLPGDLQDSQRMADLIVERITRRDRRAELLDQLRRQVLGRGLASRPGDADDSEIRCPVDDSTGELAERGLHVGHDDRRAADRPGDEDGHRAGRERRSSERVPVGPRAGQGGEQAARHGLARVDHDRPGDQRLGIRNLCQPRTGGGRYVRHRQRDHASSAKSSIGSSGPPIIVASSAARRCRRAAAATSRSSNGMTVPAMYWPCS